MQLKIPRCKHERVCHPQDPGAQEQGGASEEGGQGAKGTDHSSGLVSKIKSLELAGSKAEGESQ